MKNIENISSLKEVRKEIQSQNEKFDIFEFYLQNINTSEIVNSGLGIITESQTFYCYNYGKHEYLVEKVYDALYDDFYEIYKKNNYDYRETSLELNNICIQLMSKYYSLIWMPQKINKYQLSKLFEMYDSLIRINDYLKQKGKKEIVVCVCAKDRENVKMFNFLEDFTSIISMVYDKIKVRDENAVVQKGVSDAKRLKLRQNISL